MQNFNCDFNARWIPIATLGQMASYRIPNRNRGLCGVGGSECWVECWVVCV